jgi:hypothetical protein
MKGDVMRTLPLSLAGTVILVLLGGTSAVVGQGEDEDSRVTQFSGTIIGERFHVEGETHIGTPPEATQGSADGVTRSTGNILEWTVEWTDPRLPPTMWHRVDYDLYDPDSALPYATSVLLLGEKGSWSGTGRGVGYDEGFVQVLLIGEGAYEGLYAILDRKDATLPDDTAQRTFDGFIFEGEPIPIPDPVEPVE